VDWVRASATVLAHLSDTVNPQGLVAVCRIPTVELAEVFAGQPRLVSILAHVRDPGNAGTVIRVADAAGADGVVITRSSVDVYNAKAVRSSAGSLFHLPVATEIGVEEAVAAARDRGLRVLGADGASTSRLDQLESSVLAAPTAWVFGNEAWGLPEQVRQLCDDVVAIPIYGRAESLNLSTAAAVCLYATAAAQRG
jgi:TrmH family RNA methyltransferase